MSESRGRIFGIVAALAVLWIFVYWWWEPRSATISFDGGPPAAEGTPAMDGRAVPAEFMGGDGKARPVSVQELTQAPVPAVVPPRYREYTVKDGETLEQIARRELGSAAYVGAILESNPLTSADNMVAGRKILLPVDPENIQGRPNPAAVAAVQQPAETQPPVREYTVQSGDTLSKIAREHYGSTRYDEFLYQANRDRLRNKDELQLGQKLRLPPKPGAER